MNNETARYIIIHFPNLLTERERIAIRHQNTLSKLADKQDPRRIEIYKGKGWLTDDPEVLELLKDGYNKFELATAQRIMDESSDQVFLNTCPKCNRLTRTPQARQCRHCGHNWHELTLASFKLNCSFQPTGRKFYLIGEIFKGEVKVGNFIDLTMVGLNCKPKIEAIEFALKRENGISTEYISLGTSELTEKQKEHLKKLGAFGTPFDIVKEI
ncbi:hypothetical protein [Mangrovimonas spongiae]|uniref:hypothetical protein n=1 Tax=Mangrovimonas spongiae TaxID=2494697 RepID=UPI00197FCABF|nr:hypothetical protein [Mangrovimonas spongiae]